MISIVATLKAKILLLSLTQSSAVQMCDMVNEIELERERCENRTAGNITTGKVYQSWDAEGHPTRWLYVFNIVIDCGLFSFQASDAVPVGG